MDQGGIGTINDIEFITEPSKNVELNPELPSQDSEVIANLLDGFQYDPSKTKEVIAIYDALREKPEQELTRKLKRKDSQN